MSTTTTDPRDVTRPIVGIENRTAQEVFDIMCDRFNRALTVGLPEIPDDDSDFTPELARKIMVLYRTEIVLLRARAEAAEAALTASGLSIVPVASGQRATMERHPPEIEELVLARDEWRGTALSSQEEMVKAITRAEKAEAALSAVTAENDRLREALVAILSEETVAVHVGYDSGAGGGNYVYADAIRTDSDAFVNARAALLAAIGADTNG